MRSFRTAVLLGLTLVTAGIGSTAAIALTEQPTTTPSETDTATPTPPTTAPTRGGRGMRLVQPYSLVTDLSDEQKQQIAAIHQEILEKKHALEAEEEARCNAVLSDAQKTAMQEAVDRQRAERKRASAPAR